MIRNLLRETGRRVLGPGLFDSLVQFRRLPVRSPVRSSMRPTRWVFVEPHYDDVVFSCGGTLASLVREGRPVELITVFTADAVSTAPLSPLAQAVHAGWAAGERPYEQRRQEAARMGTLLPVQRTVLDLPEALYRDPHLTTIDEVLQPQATPESDPSFASLCRALDEALGNEEHRVIVAPLGVGGHIDHLLVHAAIRAVVAMRPTWTVWFYEDFPYTLDIPALKRRVRTLGASVRPSMVDITDTLDARVELSTCYTSQVRAIFETPARLGAVIRGYAGNVGTPARPRERLWTTRGEGVT